MKEITATIIKELAPVMSPKEIQKEYGINFLTLFITTAINMAYRNTENINNISEKTLKKNTKHF